MTDPEPEDHARNIRIIRQAVVDEITRRLGRTQSNSAPKTPTTNRSRVITPLDGRRPERETRAEREPSRGGSSHLPVLLFPRRLPGEYLDGV